MTESLIQIPITITENESKALELAKRVFEHFTKDALPFAREILSLEEEIGSSLVNGTNGSSQDIKRTNGNQPLTDFPVSDITASHSGEHTLQENQMNGAPEVVVHNPADDLPF